MTKTHSDAIVVDGPLIFVSGQVPDASDGSVAAWDAAEQTRQVFHNLEKVLAQHGADLRHLVKLTYYLRHISDLGVVQEVLQEFLVHQPRPTATLVEVAGFVDARYLMELDAVARLPRDDRSAPAT
ncbi:RidA family protein [Allosalinactinospora lopnorensis]|uniref:RidA family protein n=1 Tax=Allosalinactinospora lopnorensis TaxID=1352348 RepID=UPI000623BCD7|nr:RidA family protein [Allosalinactinospora lopnorensis]